LIDDQFEFGRLFDWHIRRFRPAKNPVDVVACAPEHVHGVRPVRNEASRFDVLSKPCIGRTRAEKADSRQPARLLRSNRIRGSQLRGRLEQREIAVASCLAPGFENPHAFYDRAYDPFGLAAAWGTFVPSIAASKERARNAGVLLVQLPWRPSDCRLENHGACQVFLYVSASPQAVIRSPHQHGRAMERVC
jgi:hypothetical protein